jgi:hypothetical protein
MPTCVCGAPGSTKYKNIRLTNENEQVPLAKNPACIPVQFIYAEQQQLRKRNSESILWSESNRMIDYLFFVKFCRSGDQLTLCPKGVSTILCWQDLLLFVSLVSLLFVCVITETLQVGAKQFQTTSTRIRRKFWWKNCKVPI